MTEKEQRSLSGWRGEILPHWRRILDQDKYFDQSFPGAWQVEAPKDWKPNSHLPTTKSREPIFRGRSFEGMPYRISLDAIDKHNTDR